MESLCSYESDDDEDESTKIKDGAGLNSEQTDGRVLELDVNYDNVTMEMSEDSSSDPTSTYEGEQIKDGVCATPLLSSPSSTSSLSSSSLTSSSKSETGSSKRKHQLAKVDSHKRKKSRSPSRRKSFDQECSSIHLKMNVSKDEASRDKRVSEPDRCEESGEWRKMKNRDSDYRGTKRRSSRSPRRGERSHHHQSRRSRSPIQRRRSSSRHRSHGSSNKYRDRNRDRESSKKGCSRSRSRSRSHGHSSKKSSKLTILGRLGIDLKVPEGSMTPQMALQKSMQEQVAKVKDATGIALPSYYNPIAVNPSKYAEQMQKRKLLWGGGTKVSQMVAEKKEDGEGKNKSFPAGPASLWQGTTFSQDRDGKLTAKFKRLMGIKNADERQQATTTSSNTEPPSGVDLIKKQEEMFNSMEMQYEVARVATHTHRGLGLGFGLHQYPR